MSPAALVAANHFRSLIFQAMSSTSPAFLSIAPCPFKKFFQLNAARLIYLLPVPKNSEPVLTSASVSTSLEPKSGAQHSQVPASATNFIHSDHKISSKPTKNLRIEF